MAYVAALQMTSGCVLEDNLAAAEELLNKAAAHGVRLAILPENFALLGKTDKERLAVSEPDGTGRIQQFLSDCAKKHAMWIVGGTVPLRTQDDKRVRSACLVFDENGERVARFDKIHLFDVHIPDSSETYNESDWTEAGEDVVVIDSPVGRVGLAVCYDLRFPELFRRMAERDVDVFAVPAAFTAATGKAHWELLVRARAVENLAYVIASAQTGAHANGRETHGDSMIVNPWGEILDRKTRGTGIAVARVDREEIAAIRRSFPALKHRRL